jgi:hypothetical protein
VTPEEAFPAAIETLKYLSDRPDITLILWTSSWPKEIEFYTKLFQEYGIKFKYVNSNPEVVSRSYGCYDSKFYFALLIDDKAGFNAETDWYVVYNEFSKQEHLSPVK